MQARIDLLKEEAAVTEPAHLLRIDPARPDLSAAVARLPWLSDDEFGSVRVSLAERGVLVLEETLACRPYTKTAKALLCLELHPHLSRCRAERRVAGLKRGKTSGRTALVQTSAGDLERAFLNYRTIAQQYDFPPDYLTILIEFFDSLKSSGERERWRETILRGEAGAQKLRSMIEDKSLSSIRKLRHAIAILKTELSGWNGVSEEDRQDLRERWAGLAPILPQEFREPTNEQRTRSDQRAPTNNQVPITKYQ